jgi:hypothetical protein
MARKAARMVYIRLPFAPNPAFLTQFFRSVLDVQSNFKT